MRAKRGLKNWSQPRGSHELATRQGYGGCAHRGGLDRPHREHVENLWWTPTFPVKGRPHRAPRQRSQGVPMRKIFAFLVATADGYYVGPNEEFDWPIVDEEFNEFAVEQLDEADTLMFGRATYQLMAGYWPTPAAKQDDPEVAARMNSLPKIVVSRTLDQAEWANTRLIGDDVVEELTKLKQQPGKDIVILGSSDLTVNLVKAGLVDELR